jgi:S-methylmethionine-dependent homocysteine/selenocysteine methylase
MKLRDSGVSGIDRRYRAKDENMTQRYENLKGRIRNREIVILDGGIGSEMLRRGLTWEGHKVESEPDAIRAIHADYIRAGADVVSTNTFQLARRSYLNHFADPDHMRRIGAPDLETRARVLIREGVKRALEARDQAGRGNVCVAGAMTTLEWCFRPDMTPSLEDMRAEYRETIQAFKDAGADLMLFETFNSSKEARTAFEAAREVGIPAWLSFVCDWQGRLLDGETAAQLHEGLAGLEPDALLFNCAPVPDITRALGKLAREYSNGPRPALGGYAHVGRFDPPDWMFTDEYPPDRYLSACREWVSMGAQVVGGCCGTRPMHIEALKKGLPKTLPV